MSDSAKRGSTFGLLAVIAGFLAFAAVVGHFFVGPVDPPPPIEVSIAEKAADIRDATVAALRGEEYEARDNSRPKTLDDYLTYSFLGLALLAILLAVIGFVKHESLRPNIAGAALGGLAIAFQFATVVFFALLFVLLISAVLDQLDFSF